MSTLSFTLVPVRARRDGWTPVRQVAFFFALQDLRNVAAACRAVGMSWQSAYRLRARPDAKSFAAAWDAALAGPDLSRPVGGSAIDGTVTPIRYRGRQVGERRRYNDRLAMYLLAVRRPDRYAPDRGRCSQELIPFDVLGTRDDDEWPCSHAVSRDDVARTSSPSAPDPRYRPGRRSAPSVARHLDSG